MKKKCLYYTKNDLKLHHKSGTKFLPWGQYLLATALFYSNINWDHFFLFCFLEKNINWDLICKKIFLF